MALLEFQVDANVLATALSNGLRQQPICFGQETTLQGTTYVVDRVLVGDSFFAQAATSDNGFSPANAPMIVTVDGTSQTLANAPQLLLHQSITALVLPVSTLDVLNGAQPQMSDYVNGAAGGVPLDVLLGVSVRVVSPPTGAPPTTQNTVQIRIDFRTLESLFLSDAELQALNALVQPLFPPLVFPLPLNVIPNTPTPLNAGVGFGSETVVIRIEVDSVAAAATVFGVPIGTDAATQWADFFAGATVTRGNESFTLGIDPAFLAEMFTFNIENAIGNYNHQAWSGQQILIDSGPDSKWHPTGTADTSNPTITVSLTATKEGGCWCFFSTIDVGFDASVDASFSVPSSNTLAITLHADASIHAAALLCCVPSGVTPTGLAFDVALYGGDNWGAVGIAIDSGIGFVGFLGTTLIALFGVYASPVRDMLVNEAIGSFVDLAGTTKTVDSEGNTVLSFPFTPSKIPLLGTPTITSLSATSQSATEQWLLLGGTLPAVAKSATSTLTVTIYPFELGWGADPCSDPVIGYYGAVDIDASGSLTICSVDIAPTDDPTLQFTPFLPALDQIIAAGAANFEAGRIELAIPDEAILPPYRANPYPLKLTILTSAGVRHLSMPLTPATADGLAKSNDDLLKFQALHCHNFIDQWRGPASAYIPQWTPDPAPKVDVHVWDIVITGLLDGDGVAVSLANGDTASAVAHGGTAQMSVAVPPALSSSLQLSRTEGPRSVRLTMAPTPPTLTMLQTPFAVIGQLALSSPMSHPLFLSVGESVVVLGASANGIEVVQFRGGTAEVVGSIPMSGVRGLIRSGAQILAWGPAGLFVVSSRGAPRTERVLDAPILSITARQGLLYVVEPHGMVVLSSELRPVARAAASGIRAVTAIDGVLLVSEMEAISRWMVEPTTGRLSRMDLPPFEGSDCSPTSLPQGIRAAWITSSTQGGGEYVAGLGAGRVTTLGKRSTPPWNLPARSAKAGNHVASVERSGAALVVRRALDAVVRRSL